MRQGDPTKESGRAKQIAVTILTEKKYALAVPVDSARTLARVYLKLLERIE